MPSVATQTAMGDVLPICEPGSPREPIQRTGTWTVWQHASYKPRTRRGGMVGRYIRQGQWCPHVKLMKHRSVNTSTKNTASFKIQRSTMRTVYSARCQFQRPVPADRFNHITTLMAYAGHCSLQTRVEADAFELELLQDFQAAIISIRFWQCVIADLDAESTAVTDIDVLLWVSQLPTISL